MTMKRGWNHTRRPSLGIFNLLSLSLGRWSRANPQFFPDLRGAGDITVASDYGGDTKSKYRTYSYLMVPETQLLENWNQKRWQVRREYSLGTSELSYEDIGGTVHDQAVWESLRLADTLDGLLCVVAVHSSIKTLFDVSKYPDPIEVANEEFRKWKPGDYERMRRISWLLSLFVHGLIDRTQSVKWISDEDNIVQRDRLALTRRYVQATMKRLGNRPNRLFASNDTRPYQDLPPSSFFFKDLLSIPDLAAGTVADTLTELASNGRFLSLQDISQLQEKDLDFKQKAGRLLTWLVQNNHPLRRLVICVTPGTTSHTRAIRLLPFGASTAPEHVAA